MRFVPFALALALGLATASTAQPVVDGDLTDAQYVLLDDNTGGPSTGFGVPTNGDGGSILTSAYAHVDVPSQTLYLGFGGTTESNFNKLLVFLDTRSGGANGGDYGVSGGFSGFDGFNQDNTFDAGFEADFGLSITRGDDGSGTVQIFADIVEFVGDRATGTSVSRYVFGPGSPGNVDIALISDAATTETNISQGYEIAIPFGSMTASDATPIVVTESAVSLFPIITSGGGDFLSNQTLSPLAPTEGNLGNGIVDFGTEPANPLAYVWNRSSATAGWRLYGPGVQATTVRDFALQNHVQGVTPSVPGTGSIPNGTPNLYAYGGLGNGPAYTTYSSDGDPMGQTAGQFWYHYDTMVSDRWVALPFTLQNGGVDIATSFVTGEYSPDPNGTAAYLLANPYAAAFDTAELMENTGYTLSNSVFVWNPDIGVSGDYDEIDRTDPSLAARSVAPMTGFWAELTDTSNGTLGFPNFQWNAAGRVRPGTGTARSAADRAQIAFELDLVDGDDTYTVDRTTRLVFANGAGPGVDAFDATEPPAIATQYARLSFVDGDRLRAVVGRELDPTEPITQRLSMAAVALGEQTYRLRWDADALPAGWTAELRDLATGTVTDLRAASDLVFTAGEDAAERFELVVVSSSVVSSETASESIAEVVAPRPNPSTGLATMHVRVDRPQTVRVEAFDLLGRRVALVFEGAIDAEQRVALDATAFAPGLYVVRTTGETFATSHRLTVAR